MDDTVRNDHLIELTADIVAAYVGNNPLQMAELPGLIGQVHSALNDVASGAAEQPRNRSSLLFRCANR